MSIQIVSDLHLEVPMGYDIFTIPPRAPYLALLGDIGNVAKHKTDFLGFLRLQLRQFRAVLFVPGNHEAYGSTWQETQLILCDFESEVRADPSLGEFVLLDHATFRIPDISRKIVFLGCSLFSFVPPESERDVEIRLNDFSNIGGWSVEAHNAAHKRSLDWLNARVAELEQEEDVKMVILTHWSPSLDPRATEARHRGGPISSAFSTDLSGERCFRSGKVNVWAFGHTHYNVDFSVERDGGAGPLRLITNQRGYYFAQAKGFEVEKTIEL
ncbi:calcineurin-like phosphoesterase [Immersiella caudata]|uniref:Calcineurin-like phosphoesterase n=1 Tax=Immersiella caudata TaxID=314043 RepID=A0AA39U225_9PEZI|nr:calcineurin-like phosphoesterase [Immersiella caudata]